MATKKNLRIMRSLMRRVKEKKGFTLAETLLAVLILLLVSSIVATGIPAAKNAYEKVVLASNAQVLLSTTVSALHDELGTAWDLDVEMGGDEISYFSSDTGAKTRITKTDPSGAAGSGKRSIWIQEYVSVSGLNTEDTGVGTARPLVSEAASTSSLDIGYDSVSYIDQLVVFKNLKVYKAGTDTVLAALDDGDSDLSIRVF